MLQIWNIYDINKIEKILSGWVKGTPAQRMGTPEEIANGILFIIENDFFQGRVLEIDGGLRM